MLKVDALPAIEVLSALPVFPLPNVVLLPGMILPLNVFEPRYLELVDFVRAHGQHIGVPLLRPGEVTAQGLPAFEEVLGIGKLVTHVELPDGRRLIRLEGLGRVRVQREQAQTHMFRAVQVAPLAEPYPEDARTVSVLKAQVERIARYCGEDGAEALMSLLGLADTRVLLYALTAFLPSLELLVHQPRTSIDRDRLVRRQQQSLAADTADARAELLVERATAILADLGRRCETPTTLLN
ncbi:MAG: LON peptidase substrate-binding domain-containing protein [Myxococcales bacterium]|nr:LON peptidase substrate-binding domain-containing protein [Myxococcales bacterium]